MPDQSRRILTALAAGAACGGLAALGGAGGAWAAAAGLAAAGFSMLAARRAAARADAGLRGEPRAAAGLRAFSAIDAVSALPGPAVIFDRRGIAIHVNAAAARAFSGLAAGIVLRQWFRDADFLEELEEVLAGRRHATASFSERRPFERAFRVDMALAGQGDAFGLMVFSDQTEALRVERVRADFIANASHELRTPLTAVSGFLETLQGPARNDAAARDRFVALMLEQTQRMARLIDDLLSLSRLETQSRPAAEEEVDVGRLLATLLAALVHMTREAGVEVRCDVAPGTLTVRGSPDELTQVFQNLVENACRYGAGGGRVEIAAETSDKGEPGVTVRDFGAGIPAEHLPRLTERFYRVNPQASRLQRGTGLGLAIVKHILTRHGARLAIASAEGAGSAFTVFFPVRGKPAGDMMKNV